MGFHADHGLHTIPHTTAEMIRLAFEVKRAFDTADTLLERDRGLVRLIADPAARLEAARSFCQETLKRGNMVFPQIWLISPSYLEVLVFDRPLPHLLEDQAAIAAPLKVLIATSAIEAYWIGFEAWTVPYEHTGSGCACSADDRREMVTIISATQAEHRVHMFEQQRVDGRLAELTAKEGDFTAVNILLGDLFAGTEKIRSAAHEKLTR